MKNAELVGQPPEFVLKSVFGYDSFRLLQKQIIDNVLVGKDTLAIMPTGGGKSLCYQIPALIFDGLTVVVSPLISLMQDQVATLNSAGINAVFLNSSVAWETYRESMNSIRCGETKIVYVSPEGLCTSRINDLLHDERVHVKCITIDEAHCVSEWGHDFRPDYMEIASVRQQFKDAVCLALTATATIQVRHDIIKNLGLNEPDVLLSSFDRPNIFLSVKAKKNAMNQIVDCIRRHHDESGIIYCYSKKDVDTLTEDLAAMGFSVLNYHAGLSNDVRAEHQTKFLRDEVQIMVATLAFGMGIDKPNVRFIIHHTMPKSIEQYYQEIGRAGRDGLPSEALLLYSKGDIFKIRYLFDDSADKDRAELLLKGMINYVSGQYCRRQALLKYFGETFEPSLNAQGCCDVCDAGPLPSVDMTVPVQKLMSCIIRTGSRFGAAYVIDVLLGSKQKKVIERGHDKLSTFGIGTELEKEQWFDLVDILIARDFLIKTGDYGVLQITANGLAILRSRGKFEFPFRGAAVSAVSGVVSFQKPAKKKDSFVLHKKAVDFSENPAAARLFEELRRWRRNTAFELDVPPYIIFGDKTLADIAEKCPKTETELLSVYGMGAAKASKYGDSVLRICRMEA